MVIEALKWALWALSALGLWALVGFAFALVLCPYLERIAREQARAAWNWSGDEKESER